MRGGGRPCGRLGPWGIALAVLAVGRAAPVAAQVGGQPEEDVDSARIQVLERLRSLSRPPGVDSTLFNDSTPGQPRAAIAPPQPQAADSFMAALLRLPGYSVSQYSGGGARFNAETQRMTLLGNDDEPAELRQDGMTVTAADTINLADSLLWTAGETVTDRPGEEPVRSSNIIYDRRADRGTAYAAHTTMSQGATWVMDGDLPAILSDTVFGHDINFTSCEETEPHYHFAAREFKAIGGSWFVARNVTLNFANVPVLWLPFIFQSTDSGRHSGILMPRFGVNDIVRTSRGHSRRVSNVGFFWAINDYADATFAGDWWSDNFTAATSAFRYRVTQKFLNGSANVRRFWRVGGGTELSFDTRHDWTVDERLSVRVSARYASSSSFVRQNSFDPREVTQSINSEGGLNRRFDWGNLSVSADRRQFLSDDRVEMTLPSANLSLRSITLFPAPGNSAGFFNNMTLSGSGRYRRSTVERAPQADSTFIRSLADEVRTSSGVSTALNLGALSWSQGLTLTETANFDIPAAIPFPGDTLGPPPTGLVDLATADLLWNTSLNYQQSLIGTTTLTPSLRMSGAAKRSDEIPEASSFVFGPRRLSFGVSLRSDVYGYYGGFAGFEAIRHKISPQISYSYAPKIVATNLQEAVFGSADAHARNIVTFGFNQTFEAKRPEGDEDDTGGADEIGLDLEEDLLASDSIRDVRADSLLALQEAGLEAPVDDELDAGGPQRLPASRVINLLAVSTNVVSYDFVRARKLDNRLGPEGDEDDTGGADEIGLDLEEDLLASDSIRDVRADSLLALQEAGLEAPVDDELDAGGPQRLPASRVINLLAVSTNVVSYDFVRARKLDNRLEGFTTTRLRSQISSDLLRGLQLSVEHDLFDTEDRNGEDHRIFDPVLSQLNLSFAMSSNSGVLQAIGRLLGGGGDDASGVVGATEADSAAALMDIDDLDPLIDNVGNFSPTDESSIIPGGWWNDVVGEDVRGAARRQSGGAWNANFSYSLRRSRYPSLAASQLLQMGIRLKPTEKWDLVWRTSYDIDERSFTDHTIRLTRDLHRWQANFDFLQTATGNWSFRFEVSLTDNRDLKFDYDQRSTDLTNPF